MSAKNEAQGESPGDILGVILAGGAARRMGGGDKGLAELAGRSMLARVIERLRPQVDHLILNANGDAARFASFNIPVVPDATDKRRGPLEGLNAAMMYAASHLPNTSAVVTVATDVPFLPDDLVARLRAAARGSGSIAVSGRQRHPVVAFWPVDLRDAIAAALDDGRLSVDALATRLGAAEVDFEVGHTGSETVDPLFNANTPEDIEIARRLIEVQVQRCDVRSQKS